MTQDIKSRIYFKNQSVILRFSWDRKMQFGYKSTKKKLQATSLHMWQDSCFKIYTYHKFLMCSCSKQFFHLSLAASPLYDISWSLKIYLFHLVLEEILFHQWSIFLKKTTSNGANVPVVWGEQQNSRTSAHHAETGIVADVTYCPCVTGCTCQTSSSTVT